jgi:Na+-transporting methylmalonyl-CoA/oxaloacetate decarboxylase beta subunit
MVPSYLIRRRGSSCKAHESFVKEKINPMVGAAGISLFRCRQELCKSWLRMKIRRLYSNAGRWRHVAGQLGSIVAGGMVLRLYHGY